MARMPAALVLSFSCLALAIALPTWRASRPVEVVNTGEDWAWNEDYGAFAELEPASARPDTSAPAPAPGADAAPARVAARAKAPNTLQQLLTRAAQGGIAHSSAASGGQAKQGTIAHSSPAAAAKSNTEQPIAAPKQRNTMQLSSLGSVDSVVPPPVPSATELQMLNRLNGCVTTVDPLARSSFAYKVSPPGTPCVFRADAWDEASHCISDDGAFGQYGWCWTDLGTSMWGSCSEKCPYAGQSRNLEGKLIELEGLIDDLSKSVSTQKKELEHERAELHQKRQQNTSAPFR